METLNGRILNGHVSPETAYVVEDYPYGFKLRCKIRYWIETAVNGQYKGQQRVASQTTNPKKGGVWNKPKYSTYNQVKVLFLDSQGHVKVDGCSLYSDPTPFRKRWESQLDEDQLVRLEEVERIYTALSKIKYEIVPQAPVRVI